MRGGSPILAGVPPITVTTTTDSGAGSLREAIDTANSDAGPTTITFAGGLAGGTIFLLSQLPDLTEGGTTIDGDLGSDCDPDIGLDGSAAGAGADGVAFTSDSNVVRGLAIFDFGGDGIHVGGDGNVVECTYVGTNLALAGGHGNGERGIRVEPGSEDNRIGPDDVVAHNGETGVSIVETLTPGAYPGFASLGADAVEVFPVLDFTAGPDESFQSTDAIRPVDGSGAPFIDTFGMQLSGTLTAAAAGTYTLTFTADNEGRVLLDDVEVASANHEEVQVEVELNGGHSIEVEYVEGCGGASTSVTFSGPGAVSYSTDGAIGGACAGSQAGLCGELFHLRVASERNTITESSIFDNGHLGIDLAPCGGPNPTANDPGDLDLGPNTFLNFPVITGVSYGGTPGSYTVSGTAPASSTVELFLSDSDPTGFGEGETYLASFTATGGGTFSGATALDPGDVLTATATDTDGSSSEFGPNFAAGSGTDEATVGSNSGLPGATFEIPISVRDLGLTVLGRDRPAGEKIQSLSFKVVYSPTGSFSSITAARAGITAALTPAFQSTPSTASSISYLGQFNETTNLIPFVLDTSAPGDQVAKLTITLAATAPPGTISLTLDTVGTSLGNFAGTLEETTANGRLTLTNGTITVLSNAAQGLGATAESSSTIRLRWSDPGANETGFRIERSLDGSAWSTVTTVGPDATSHLDTGRSPATLYYYRLVTLTPADSQPSNTGFATTFPATAAKVCVQRLPGSEATWAHYPSAAWNDIDDEWGVVWQAREDGIQDEIWFQRLDSVTLDPIGSLINVSESDMSSRFPTLAWNGSRYLVHWSEHQRREPGGLAIGVGTFALLEPNGDIVRRGVVPATSSLIGSLRTDLKSALSWDGTHWGFVTGEVPTTHPFSDAFYRRLEENGDVVLGPSALTTTPGHLEVNADVAFNPTLGVHGVAWIRSLDGSEEAFFQRVEESTGAALGSPESLGTLSGNYGLSMVADGAAGWAVGWSKVTPGEYATYLRKVDAGGVAVGLAAERLSDPGPSAYDFNPSLHKRPDGGFVVMSNGYSPTYGTYEIVRAEANSSGVKDGPVEFISPDDGVSSYLPAVAEDGSRFLVVWNESDPSGSPNGLEVSGLLVDADGLSAPGPKVELTTGHTPSSIPFTPGPGAIGVRPLGAGFVALWTDPAHPGEIRGRIWDGSGATINTFLPLNSAPLAGGAALAAVGDSFAVLWRTAANDYRFARYDASGLIVGENGISSAADNGVLALGFDGENYAVLIRSGSSYLFQRIDPDGNVVGSESTILSSAGTAPRLLWTGGGWAVLWRGPGVAPNLNFGFLAAGGTVITPATAVVTPSIGAINQFSLAWNGTTLGVAWVEQKTTDTVPGQDIYFTRLSLDGTKAFPEVAVESAPYGDLNPNLYWADGAFRLVYSPAVNGSGFREVAIDPGTGAVLPGEDRFWSNRAGGGAFAWNGVTLGMFWTQNALSAAHFQTGACVDDPSPPPCPSPSVASVGGAPRLTWAAVSDPQSGIWRYQVLRDNVHLAELDPTTLSFDDAGYEIATTHDYTLLAMNGAYNESDGCTPVPFSTTAGDANGNGSFEIADLFFLINFFFGDGAPPGGDADANGDGFVTVADLFYLINHFFSGGPAPV